MLGGLKPTAVAAGTMATLALVVLTNTVVSDLSDPQIEVGFPWGWASAVLGAHILGGLLAGGAARRSPGLNGALSGALCPVLLVAGFAAFHVVYNGILYGPANIVPDYLDSLPEIREFVTDEEFLGATLFALVMAVYTFAAVLVGFVAGSLAGRAKSSSVNG